MTDPIADFLTRIRNAITAAHETVDIPASKLKREMARILTEQGYIDGFDVEAKVQGGLGTAIVSTSRGVMTGHDARQQKVGGEVVAEVW
jgi:small subunit ribosomal protein S8